MKTFLFVNPLSGRYAGRRINLAVNRLNAAGLAPTVFTVTTPADALPYCRIINESAARPLVIVAAGDGTVNAVVNGLLPGKATLAVLPMGTSNVLAAEIGIGSIEDGLQRIVAGKTRQLSVGVLELANACYRFVLMAGVGIDGAVVRDAWPLGKRFLKQGAYALSALNCCLNWSLDMLEVVTPERSIACHSAIVCNASCYGGNFIIAPESSLFSPQLTAVCISNNRRRTYLHLALQLFMGRAGMSRELVRIPADVIEIRGTKPIQIDGDFVGYSPAKLTTVADFAHIIV